MAEPKKPLIAIASDVQLDWSIWMIDVRDAASALLARMDAIEASPAYQGVWTMAHVHGAIYDGLTWETEREALRRVLTSRPHGETDRG